MMGKRLEDLKKETSHLLEAFEESICNPNSLPASVVFDLKQSMLENVDETSTFIREVEHSPRRGKPASGECVQLLQSHLQELKNNLHKMESRYVQEKSEKRYLEEKSREQSIEMELELNKAQGEIQKLKSQIAAKRAGKQAFLGKFENLSDKLWAEREDAQRKIDKLQEASAEGLDELEKANEIIRAKDYQNNVLQVRIEDITEERNNTAMNAMSTKQRVKESDVVIERLRDRIRSLEGDEEATNVELMKFKRELDNSSKERFNDSLVNKSLKQKANDLESSLENVIKQQESISQANRKAEMERSLTNALRIELENTQNECSDLKFYVKNLERKIQETENNRRELESSLQTVEKLCRKSMGSSQL